MIRRPPRSTRKESSAASDVYKRLMAAMLGGNVRVGLEDSLYIGKGKLAESNKDQVAKIRRIIEDLSLEVASPKEAREMLGLKGGDLVQF